MALLGWSAADGASRSLFTQLPRETVRKGTRAVCGACILVASGSEIGLLGPALSTFETSVRGLWGLFGQFLEGEFSEVR